MSLRCRPLVDAKSRHHLRLKVRRFGEARYARSISEGERACKRTRRIALRVDVVVMVECIGTICFSADARGPQAGLAICPPSMNRDHHIRQDRPKTAHLACDQTGDYVLALSSGNCIRKLLLASAIHHEYLCTETPLIADIFKLYA